MNQTEIDSKIRKVALMTSKREQNAWSTGAGVIGSEIIGNASIKWSRRYNSNNEHRIKTIPNRNRIRFIGTGFSYLC